MYNRGQSISNKGLVAAAQAGDPVLGVGHRAGSLWRPSFETNNLDKGYALQTTFNVENMQGPEYNAGRPRPTVARFLTQMQQIKPQPGSAPCIDGRPPPSNNVTLRAQEVLLHIFFAAIQNL